MDRSLKEQAREETDKADDCVIKKPLALLNIDLRLNCPFVERHLLILFEEILLIHGINRSLFSFYQAEFL